jgi:hypothetical protein
MRAIVTGGAGFIGSALVRHLVLEKGYEVLNIDALTYAGYLPSLKAVEGKPNYKFLHANICDRAAMERAIGRHQLVEGRADPPDDVDVPPLVPAADVVRLPDPAALGNEVERARVVLDVEPVANILALSVDRQAFAGEGVEDSQGNQLFGEMVRPVIVRAVGNDDRKPVGPLPGHHEMVGRGLRRRIRRTRVVGRLLGEEAILPKRAVDLIGRYMVEAERVLRPAS